MILAYANRIVKKETFESQVKSIELYELCIKKYPDSDVAKSARLFLIDRCLILGNIMKINDKNDMATVFYNKIYENLNNQKMNIDLDESMIKRIESQIRTSK
jgi:hypothetical protein